MRHFFISVMVIALVGLVGCGSGNQSLTVGDNPVETDGGNSQVGVPIQYATEFPNSLPQDALQPWEELGNDGKVISATGASSEFFAGTQTESVSGDTSARNGALRIASGDIGAGNLSYAMYRLPLGGNEPGVLSVDANLRPMGDGNIDGYWVGLADYGNNSWQWFGPITDAHWRISTINAARESASFTTDLGNMFVCVVAHDGALIDVVGVGIDPVDVADATSPDAPTNLELTPVVDGIGVNWTAVGGSDVAGYKVYHSDKAFGEHTAGFADTVSCLHGRSFILDAAVQTWVAVSAIDKSGNESVISDVSSATPLIGIVPELDLEVDAYSTQKGMRVILTATGADTYDWDIDGDGVFDILADTTATADVDTTRTGLIRPLVRGVGADSTSVAMSAVSVLVTSNSRPVANASATPAFGAAPLPVVFTGDESTDFDGSIVGGGWDFDGDGTYDEYSVTDIVHVTSANHTYTAPGTYNAKLRVVDNEGAWDVDTVAITVDDSVNAVPVAGLSATPTSGDVPHVVEFDASTSTDSDGTIAEYSWDFDGNGLYDGYSEGHTISHTYLVAGVFTAKMRVKDDDGATGTTTIEITVNVPGNDSPTADLVSDLSYCDEGAVIALDASGSGDTDGSIVLYEYDFNGDGLYDSSGESNSASHQYSSYGIFSAKVRVTDNAGAQASASTDIRVNQVFNNIHAWPTRGHDPRHTGRSPYVGPQTNNERWSYPTGSFVNSSAAISSDGTICFGSLDHKIYALNPDGTIKWSHTTGDQIYSSPAIGADGTVYVGSYDFKLWAMNPDGTVKWEYATGGGLRGSPVIGTDGVIYVCGEDFKLYAIYPDGTKKWEYLTGGALRSSPALAADGTVYVGGRDDKLHAVNSDGSPKWEYLTGSDIWSSAAIGPDGVIYVGSRDKYLYAIYPDGSNKWQVFLESAIDASPAIGADGTLYVGAYDDFLYAINPDSTIAWSYDTGGVVLSSACIDANGMIYVGGGSGELFAFSPGGSLEWTSTTIAGDVQSSPVIGADGTLFVGSQDNELHAFGQ